MYLPLVGFKMARYYNKVTAHRYYISRELDEKNFKLETILDRIEFLKVNPTRFKQEINKDETNFLNNRNIRNKFRMLRLIIIINRNIRNLFRMLRLIIINSSLSRTIYNN